MNSKDNDMERRKTFWSANPLGEFKRLISSPEYLKLGRRPAKGAKVGRKGPVVPIRDSTQAVLTTMFGKFIAWIEAGELGIFEVTSRDILIFLGVPEGESKSNKQMKSTIRMRYVHMLERVYRHLEVQPNPASDASREIRAMPPPAQLGRMLRS